MEIEIGMKFIGNKNGREIQILWFDDVNVTYQDMKYMTVFAVGLEEKATTKSRR